MKGYEFFLIGKYSLMAYADYRKPICQKYDLNPMCLDVLMFIANNPDHNTARDLYLLRGIKSGIASVSVETLVRRGYLARGTGDDDRRIKRLYPTDEAAPIIEAGRKAQSDFFEAITAGISKEELDTYMRISEKFAKNIENINVKGPENAQTTEES